MQEINLLAGNRRLEVRKSGKPLNLFLPIELSASVIANFAQKIGIGAIVPARLRNLIGPSDAAKTVAQVIYRLG
jgi:hypothetical protein